jgi:hypothetical protein
MASRRALFYYIYDNTEKYNYDVLHNMSNEQLLEIAQELGYVDPNPPFIPSTPEEIRDEVLDRLRGGPRKYLRELADEFEMSYADFIEHLRMYSNQEIDYIGLGFDTPGYDMQRMWDSYELVTGDVAKVRDYPFSCSC